MQRKDSAHCTKQFCGRYRAGERVGKARRRSTPGPAAMVKPYTANEMTPAEVIRAEAEGYRVCRDGCVSNGPKSLAGHK